VGGQLRYNENKNERKLKEHAKPSSFVTKGRQTPEQIIKHARRRTYWPLGKEKD